MEGLKGVTFAFIDFITLIAVFAIIHRKDFLEVGGFKTSLTPHAPLFPPRLAVRI